MGHRHVMLLEFGDDGSCWFYCSDCPAIVEVFPRAVGQDLKLSLQVMNSGIGGFGPDELRELGDLWVAVFRSSMHQHGAARPGRERRRRRRAG